MHREGDVVADVGGRIVDGLGDPQIGLLRRLGGAGAVVGRVGIELIDAAVIVRGADGKVRFEETADPSGKKWAKRGAIAGGVVGLIFPPSLIVSAAVGGGVGGIWGKIRDKGFKDEDLKAMGEEMEPGTSAIIAIAEDRMIERLEQGIEGYDKIAKHAVSAEAAVAIVAEEVEEPAPVS